MLTKKLLLTFVLALGFPTLGFSAAVREFSTNSCDVFTAAGEPSCSIGTFSPGGTAPWNGVSLHTVEPIGSQYNLPKDSFADELEPHGVYLVGSFSQSFEFDGEVFPVSWDFNVQSNSNTPADSLATFSWAFEVTTFSFQEETNSIFYASGSGVPLGQSVTGSGFTSPLSGSFSSLRMHLSITSADSFLLNIPSGSTLDFNPLSDTAVPEPGTILLGGTALLGLAGFVRRRNKR